jgi:hypothetical protein
MRSTGRERIWVSLSMASGVDMMGRVRRNHPEKLGEVRARPNGTVPALCEEPKKN